MKKLVIASNNKGKIAEIAEILGGHFEVVSMKEAGLEVDIEETGTTFEQNAIIKAKACFERTGLPSLADDSGLCVDGLDGAPGVDSAVYAQSKDAHYSQLTSDQNIDLLLSNLKNIKDRSAKFVCVMVLFDGTRIISGYGETHGKILSERVGAGGFGYDPIFWSDDLEQSFALATAKDKNKVSHRRRALDDLLKHYQNS
ncbi:MAG: RdgB/HAM1 family non-canonical purine NTP pyrophosphatase [Firmicutes bacterium]|nr:RdgB/HAM1 family non-canonical purine NTP pyrophosphatase [Bacillota bacterium]